MIEEHSNLAEKFLRKGFWLYLFSFIIAPIWYIIKIILSWDLSVEEVGILYWIISLITLLWAYNDLWMTESLSHFIPKFVTEKRYDKVKSILFYAFISQLISSIIIASIFYFWASFISESYFKTDQAIQILKIFAFFFIGINIFQVLNTFFLSTQNTFLNKITEFIRMIFIMISVLSLYFLDLWTLANYSYSWLIWLYIWVIITISIFYLKYYRTYFKNEKIIKDLKFIKTIFNYAIFVLLWASAWTILWQVDMQMIIYILWTKEAGYYTNYLSIVGIPFMIIWPIFALLFPIFSQMHSKWEIKKIKLVKSIFQKNFLAIGISFNILFFVFAEVIAYILFGEKFIESGTILKYSILLLVFNFLLQINFNILAGIWKIKERAKIIFTALFINIVTNIIFIKIIWVYWAALATWLWWIIIWILSEIVLWKKYKVRFDFKYILKNTFILSFLWIFLNFYALDLFNDIWRVKWFFLLAFISIIYYLFFIIININDFKFFINEIKKLKRQ